MLGSLIDIVGSSVLDFIVLTSILVWPVKVASDFVDARNNGWPRCFMAVGMALGLVIIIATIFDGLLSLALASVAMLIAYVSILSVPGPSIVGFAISSLTLHLAVVAAYYSFMRHMAHGIAAG